MPRCNFAKRTKFFIFEIHILIPLLAAILIPSKPTLYIALVTISILWWLSRKGLDINMLERKIKKSFVGKIRYIRPSWRKEF